MNLLVTWLLLFGIGLYLFKNVERPLWWETQNPFNVRFAAGNQWEGQIGGLNGFVKFRDIKYGVRAGLIILRTYYYRHKLRTIKSIISRWAPPNENDTQSYIDFVSMQTGFSPSDVLLPREVGRVAWAIMLFETGGKGIPLHLVVEQWEKVRVGNDEAV